jgi:hypothetical protein
MDYKSGDGIKGDEPGWDSVNLIDSQAIIIECRPINNVTEKVIISYKKTGEYDGEKINRYIIYKNISESLILKKCGTTYKVNGLNVYKPYVTVETLYKIINSEQ